MKYLIWMLAVTATILAGCDVEKTSEKSSLEPEASVSTEGNPDSGKTLSDTCAECHGSDALMGQPDVPFIAGQQRDYLISALRAYKEGARDHDVMTSVVTTLGDSDLVDLAAYYNSLSVTWGDSSAPSAQQEKASTKKLLKAGISASRVCATCHGADGNSVRSGTPSLAGLEPSYLKSAFKSYFSGGRKDGIMVNFKHAVDEEQVEQLAAYFSSQEREKARFAADGNATAGKKRTSTCTGCHGIDGNSVNPTMPSLAGQNAEYLTKAMTAYRDGRRKDVMMNEAVASFTDKAIANVAAYYATQTPRRITENNGAKRFDPVADGAKIGATCNGCHGVDGTSQLAGIPNLAGLHPVYFIAATESYKSGLRPDETMKSMVSFLSETDIEEVSLYYATHEPRPAQTPRKGDAASGKEIGSGCSGCHGEGGNSTKADTPTLAGQDATYLSSAIRAYASGERDHNEMKNAVNELSADDVLNVAAWYATQTPRKVDVRLPEAPDVLAKKCDKCHGERGYSSDESKPRLAGQRETYLVKALNTYQRGERTHSAMHAMADILSAVEINAIAAYYAKQ